MYTYLYLCLFSQGMLQSLNKISHILYIPTTNSNGEYKYINFGSTSYIWRRSYICLFRIMSTTTLNQFLQKTTSIIYIYIIFIFFIARVFYFLFVHHRRSFCCFILPFRLYIYGVFSLYLSFDYQIPITRYIRRHVLTYLNKVRIMKNIINI